MAQFMLSTFEALLAGDVSPQDACYTISAHLAAAKARDGGALSLDSDIQSQVTATVESVLNGTLSAEQATKRLLALKEDSSKVMPHHAVRRL